VALRDDLLELEQGFWTQGADYYRAHLDDHVLVAFGGMASVMSRDAVVSTVHGNRWNSPEIAAKGFLEPAPGVALLTYAARATKQDGTAYAATVTSGYARRGEDWKMVFHQQTPAG
jgi:hypothetical protein